MRFTVSLKKNEDFREVYKKRKSKADKRFVVYKLNNNTEYNRLGISVSKKVGNSVVRHRIKRLVKEVYRTNESLMEKGLDIIVVARKDSYNATFNEVSKSLMYLLSIQDIVRKR